MVCLSQPDPFLYEETVEVLNRLSWCQPKLLEEFCLLSMAISTQKVGPLSDDIASGGELLTTESGAGAGAGVENANGTAVSPGSGDSFNWSSLTKLVFLKLISGSDSRSISYTISNFV